MDISHSDSPVLKPESENSPCLRELLCQHYEDNKNDEGKKFLCAAKVEQLVTRERVSSWIESNPLRRSSDPSTNDEDLIERLLDHSRLLFAILVVAKLEYLTFGLLSKGLSDNSLPGIDTSSLGLSQDEQACIDEHRYIGGVILGKEHLHLSHKAILPFTKRTSTGRNGSSGVINKVEVSHGHLEDYDEAS